MNAATNAKFFIWVVAALILLVVARYAIRVAKTISFLWIFRRKVLFLHLKNTVQYAPSGGVVIFQTRRNNKIVRFKKYINTDEDYGLDLIIPLSKFSAKNLKIINGICLKENLGNRIIEIRQNHKFLFIDIGKDDKIFLKTVPAFLDVLGLSENEYLRLCDYSLHREGLYGLVLGKQPESLKESPRYQINPNTMMLG